MSYNPKDHYFKKAKEQNFLARSVFKLEEIDQKLKIIHPHQKILDLGASPGSWSQYCAKKIGLQGRILGVDLTSIPLKLSNATFIQADLRDINLEEIFLQNGFSGSFDVVLSDMAPKTTGIRVTDQTRSFELCEIALNVAQKFLKKDGHFVCKLFHSDEFATLRDLMKKEFSRVEIVKPDSTRKISKEIFLIGIKKNSKENL
ncbi:MAG: RlmE family RNA methyltransferase [Moraxellaceae bacterium]|nr:RlmE family RNA methyltransferase [Pseudobdellovibrionaceae bacterium]